MGDRSLRAGLALSVVLVLAACSGGPGASSTSSSTAAEAPTAAISEGPTEAPTEIALPTNTAAPTSLDPCQLVTQAEASTLVGAAASPGVSSTVAANVKLCAYQAGTSALDVEVAVAPDQTTLQTDEQVFVTKLQQSTSKGLTVTDLSGIGDKAEYVASSVSQSGQTLNVAAIYVVKGLTFFSISDVALNASAPSSDLLQTQAQTTLSRIP